ncbi:unnamed protein product [Polarella glacialis]|uniref:Eukaryotic translation initiation factor 2D-like PUA RNA-binding domain-containing protein n=1 Tax=Polarella glacialis TaxID=89957 RepID=A0A813HXK0_POLGL|nr:unnamed protein product [Polarella glacialis]
MHGCTNADVHANAHACLGHICARQVVKLDNRCLLYSAGDAAPVFFDAEGRGELYPTMHTLWLHPNMMLELTIHPPVSKFVLNGADLMLPGVLVPANGVAGFGTVTKGQPRCIKIEGNPYPIAVGKMLVNQSTMEKLKGKGMEVMHVYKDTLWGFCGKAVPNAGFSEMEDEVTPCNDNSWKPGDAAPAAKASTPAAEDASSAEPAAAAAPATSAPAVPSAVRGSCGAAGGGRAADDWTQDDLLDFTFMQAFKLSLTDEKAGSWNGAVGELKMSEFQSMLPIDANVHDQVMSTSSMFSENNHMILQVTKGRTF